MRRNNWKDYFTFSKKERVAVIILLAVIVLLVLIPFLYPDKNNIVVDENLKQQLAELDQQSSENTSSYSPRVDTAAAPMHAAAAHFNLFNFDPNTLDEAGFQRLGLREKTIHTLINYRSKGGRFRQPEDIKKIYGLHEDEATQLIPYIKISGNQTTYTPRTDATVYDAKKYPALDINSATITQLKTLPGIDDALGNRIIKFRSILHGFTSVDQVKQTNGLPDSVFRHIRPYLKIVSTH